MQELICIVACSFAGFQIGHIIGAECEKKRVAWHAKVKALYVTRHGIFKIEE